MRVPSPAQLVHAFTRLLLVAAARTTETPERSVPTSISNALLVVPPAVGPLLCAPTLHVSAETAIGFPAMTPAHLPIATDSRPVPRRSLRDDPHLVAQRTLVSNLLEDGTEPDITLVLRFESERLDPQCVPRPTAARLLEILEDWSATCPAILDEIQVCCHQVINRAAEFDPPLQTDCLALALGERLQAPDGEPGRWHVFTPPGTRARLVYSPAALNRLLSGTALSTPWSSREMRSVAADGGHVAETALALADQFPLLRDLHAGR